MSDQSKKLKKKRARRQRAHRRVRRSIRGTEARPRLAVFKSLRYIYAQVIDDDRGVTIASASSLDSALTEGADESAKSAAAARKVGKAIAERAKEKGVDSVVFDRGGYIYHGRVREVAEGAREAGLVF